MACEVDQDEDDLEVVFGNQIWNKRTGEITNAKA